MGRPTLTPSPPPTKSSWSSRQGGSIKTMKVLGENRSHFRQVRLATIKDDRWWQERGSLTSLMEIAMPSRRSLSCVLGLAGLTGGLLAVNRASARSATPGLVGINGWLNTD